MTKYIAFLRGINVGGNKLIKMTDLKAAFVSLGFKDVKTFIQSGNVLFGSKKSEIKSLQKKIEKKLKSLFGFDISVIIRTEEDLKIIIEGNPFKKIKDSDKGVKYITFLAEEYKNKLKLPLLSPKKDVKVIDIIKGNAFSLSYPGKDGRFGFPNAFIEKELGISATTRNPKTLERILEIFTSS